MPKIYLDNALHVDSIGTSAVYAAAFLHKLIFGRVEDDMKSQQFFSEKALKIQPSEFVKVITSLCEGYDKLELLEAGKEDVHFEKVIKTSRNYRLTANVGTDPKTKESKFHLRYFWSHGDDEEFQAEVARGRADPFSPDEPAWKPTTRGIALKLQDLKEFLEADICGLLVNTIVKQDIKKWVKEVVLYICSQNEHLIPKFFEVYKQSSKKDFEQSLKTLLKEYLAEHPDIDTIKLTQEMPVLISLLHLHRAIGLGPM